MNTNELIRVFEDTQEIVKTDPALQKATEETCQNTVLYEEGFFSQKATVKSQAPHITVMEGTSFQCAQIFAGADDRTAVLNFANPFEPGGGVSRGARAQEECLCRCSNLYSSICIPEMMERYYAVHNANRKNYLFSDRIIYSPSVTVLKDDTDYSRLPVPFRVDIITCAAPYNVFSQDPELLKRTYRKRLTNIFEAAMENDVDVLILGAFGCGAFHNPPELMAEAFRELIQDKYWRFFKQICFPLLRSMFNNNFEVFSKVFQNGINHPED